MTDSDLDTHGSFIYRGDWTLWYRGSAIILNGRWEFGKDQQSYTTSSLYPALLTNLGWFNNKVMKVWIHTFYNKHVHTVHGCDKIKSLLSEAKLYFQFQLCLVMCTADFLIPSAPIQHVSLPIFLFTSLTFLPLSFPSPGHVWWTDLIISTIFKEERWLYPSSFSVLKRCLGHCCAPLPFWTKLGGKKQGKGLCVFDHQIESGNNHIAPLIICIQIYIIVWGE